MHEPKTDRIKERNRQFNNNYLETTIFRFQ